MGKVHTVANEQEKTALIRPDMIQKAIEVEAKRSAEERRKQFEREFSGMSLLDIFSSGQISRTRREVIRELIRELIQAGAEDETIKSIIRPELTEAEVQEKKKRGWKCKIFNDFHALLFYLLCIIKGCGEINEVL